MACSPDSPYGDVISPKELDPSNEIVVSWRKAVQDWRDHWFGLTATPLLYADSMQAVDTFLGNEMMWAVVPLAAGRRPHAGAGGPCADLPSDRPGP